MIPLDVWRDRIVIRRGDGVSADEASQTLNWFFGHLDNSDGVRRQKIFQWVTGRARLPPNGFEVSQWTWVNMLGWPATKFTLFFWPTEEPYRNLVPCTLYIVLFLLQGASGLLADDDLSRPEYTPRSPAGSTHMLSDARHAAVRQRRAAGPKTWPSDQAPELSCCLTLTPGRRVTWRRRRRRKTHPTPVENGQGPRD